MNKVKELKNRLLLSKTAEYVAVFFIGGTVYLLVELLWRGYSHTAMFFAGGICFAGIYFLETRLSGKLIYRCLTYASLITVVEFVFGVVFNLILGLEIWDYSGHFLNLLGQVCPLFFVIWTAFSLPAVYVAGKIRVFFLQKKSNIA